MPSASAKLEKQMSSEMLDPMKQIVTIVEKKVRNLEKRKGKLDALKSDSQSGKELNEDQKKAVEKYGEVLELLEFAKELQKQFNSVIQENARSQKRLLKQKQVERQQKELLRIKEMMVYQDLLSNMGGEEVRTDFLNGDNGAVKLSEEELNCLDELYRAICPERETENSADFDNILSASAEHVQALLDSRNKQAFGTTYKALREILQKIHTCNYFNKSQEAEAPSEPKDEPEVTQEDKAPSEEVEKVAPERHYFPTENAYVEPPIQEVLSGQGSLDFLQESQIDAPHSEPAAVHPPYSNLQYPAQCTRRPSEEAILMANHVAPLLLSNQQASISPNLPKSDFDPIPTQTYTNQSFSSVVHPLMAQAYVPTTHAIPPNMGVLPPRPTSTRVSQMPSESSAHISPVQYEHAEDGKRSFGNHPVMSKSRATPAYSRAQVEFVNDQGSRGGVSLARESGRVAYRN